MSVKYIICTEGSYERQFKTVKAMAKCYYTGDNERFDPNTSDLIIHKRINKIRYELRAGKWYESCCAGGKVLPMTKNEKLIMNKVKAQVSHMYHKRYLKLKAEGYDFCPF